MTTAYRMPAEWEKQEATWLAWPRKRADWPGKFQPIPWVYGEIIRHIAAHQTVRLLVRDEREEAAACTVLELAHAPMDRVELLRVPTNRIWLRDSGPIFVRDAKNKKAMLHFRFNAWAKYPDHKQDAHVPEQIAAYNQLPLIKPMHKGKRVVLEGGAIDVNGAGSLLTSEECLLSDIQCRNPGFTHEDYEAVFALYLGTPNVIWLGRGIDGDDTHGHIDDLARFVAPSAVATVVERNKTDPNYAPLTDNVKRLKKARDEKGRQLDIIELPMPRPLYFEGQRLPVSYANFLIINGAVLMPTFNDPADRIALNLLAECFPKREIIGIHAVDFVLGLGTLHCMSQQEPA